MFWIAYISDLHLEERGAPVLSMPAGMFAVYGSVSFPPCDEGAEHILPGQ